LLGEIGCGLETYDYTLTTVLTLQFSLENLLLSRF